MKKRLICLCWMFILSGFTHANETHIIASPLINHCEQKSKQNTEYSICLDEAVKQIERELETWRLETNEKVSDIAKKLRNNAILTEHKKANKYYQQFIEAKCRSEFFKEQDATIAANLFRTCKIEHIHQRIEQLKNAQ